MPNPLANDASCSPSFNVATVSGSHGAQGTVTDQSFAFCYRENPEVVHEWSGLSSPCWSAPTSSAPAAEPAACPTGYTESRYGGTTANCPNSSSCQATNWMDAAHGKEFSRGCPSQYPWLPFKVRECEKL